MACSSCGSINQGNLSSEVGIHFQELRNANRVPALVFPDLLQCLNCGKAELVVPKAELDILARGDATESD
jgi:hypothetical protein